MVIKLLDQAKSLGIFAEVSAHDRADDEYWEYSHFTWRIDPEGVRAEV